MRLPIALALLLAIAPAGATTPHPADPPRGQAESASLPTVIVYKSPSCGCCSKWIEHMRANGFEVDARNHDDMAVIKQELGVPLHKASCHTAKVGSLVIEGHVPAEDVKRLLANPGAAVGLTAAGMPMGSPGMEMPDGRKQPYVVEQINRDGSTTPFAAH